MNKTRYINKAVSTADRYAKRIRYLTQEEHELLTAIHQKTWTYGQ